ERKVLRIIRDENSSPSRRAKTVVARILGMHDDLGLLSSQLVALIADFELFVLKVMTLWLEHDPSHIGTRKRDYSLEQLFKVETIEELRESEIQSFLEEHMRKSAQEWFTTF